MSNVDIEGTGWDIGNAALFLASDEARHITGVVLTMDGGVTLRAPRRQFVVSQSGIGEIECGDGSRRRFGPGDILLAEDTTGQGHITREIQGPRRGIFIPLSQDFDIRAWQAR